MATAAEQEHVKTVQYLSCEECPPDRTIVYCSVQDDTLSFKVHCPDRNPTQNNVLTFVLSAKAILQDVCQQGLLWDQE